MANESRGSIFILKFHIFLIIFHVSSGFSLSMDANMIPMKDKNSTREEIWNSILKSVFMNPESNHLEEVNTSPEIDNSVFYDEKSFHSLPDHLHVAAKRIFEHSSCSDSEPEGEVTRICQNCIKITRAKGAYDACCTNKRNAFKWCKRIFDFTHFSG